MLDIVCVDIYQITNPSFVSGCSQCDNEPSFQQGDHVPILPLPPVAILQKCSSMNHHKCFTKALQKQLFQAHSVEELVVWLLESEKECTIEAYVEQMQLRSHVNKMQLEDEEDWKSDKERRDHAPKG